MYVSHEGVRKMTKVGHFIIVEEILRKQNQYCLHLICKDCEIVVKCCSVDSETFDECIFYIES